MKNKKRWLLLSGILILVGLGSYLTMHYFGGLNLKPSSKSLNGMVAESEYDIVFGAESAPLTIYMYSSYECAYCQRFFTECMEPLKATYFDVGLVRLVVKLVDTREIREVMYAYQAAVCVNKYGTFDKFDELLTYNNEVIYSTEFKDLVDGYILKNEEIAECMLNHHDYAYLKGNNSEYKSFELSGTPTFIINQHVYKGYKNFAAFDDILRYELQMKLNND